MVRAFKIIFNFVKSILSIFMSNISSGVYGRCSVELEDKGDHGKNYSEDICVMILNLWLCFVLEQ